MPEPFSRRCFIYKYHYVIIRDAVTICTCLILWGREIKKQIRDTRTCKLGVLLSHLRSVIERVSIVSLWGGISVLKSPVMSVCRMCRALRFTAQTRGQILIKFGMSACFEHISGFFYCLDNPKFGIGCHKKKQTKNTIMPKLAEDFDYILVKCRP